MFLAAVLRAGTQQTPAKVRNMSPNGAMVEVAIVPTSGSQVELIRGALIAQGTVMWTSAGCCGVRFSSEVSIKEWLAPANKVHQQRVDEMVALVKSGGALLRGDTERSKGLRTPEQLVDDLQAVVMLIQDLENNLVASDETLQRHAMKIQNLDIAMQMLRAVSAELLPERDGGPARLARLEDLRVACAQALSAKM